jgi:glucose/arabinose dehydrogenase
MLLVAGFIVMMFACGPKSKQNDDQDTVKVSSDTFRKPTRAYDSLPAPFATESVKNFSKVIGWKEGTMPRAPEGFTVSKYADGLDHPRWIYVAPNGDVLVSEANTETKGVKKLKDEVTGKADSKTTGESANRITLFRDTNQDGQPDIRKVFLSNLNQPFGMLILGNTFYVANTDGLMQYPYQEGQTEIKGSGKKIVALPAGGYNNHWTRNIIANRDGSKIYIAVGSGSNVGENGMEHEARRANILEVNPDGTGERIYASGLRNPVGMDWHPEYHTLWTAVNERDELGDDLVPDYLTQVMEGIFYGWPYAYFGKNEDPRRKGERPDLVEKSVKPDLGLGAHTASLGLVFYDGKMFPEKYHNGAFIGQHGSWNRSELSGYKVIYAPFDQGRPTGETEDFLTGFIANAEKSEVYGRPVGVAILKDGSLLVADDAGNTLWRVSVKNQRGQ